MAVGYRNLLAAWLLLLLWCASASAQLERLPAPLADDEYAIPSVVPSSQSFPAETSATPNFDYSAPAISPGQDYFDYDAYAGQPQPGDDWTWQLLPDGLIYRAYLASAKESRLSAHLYHENDTNFVWDTTVGARVGIFRYGTTDPWMPEGFQVDVEGSAQVRLNVPDDVDVQAVDFRGGIPLTYGVGPHRFKVGYYHISSHLGDEFLLDHPSFNRLNFARDTIYSGYSYYFTPNFRVYADLGWAFYTDISKPWEVLFGFDYAPAYPTGWRGAPFVAMNGHLRQELNYSGNFVAQAGWAWRADRSTHLLRTGLHYYNGLSNEYSFYQYHEQQIGYGLWYDF